MCVCVCVSACVEPGFPYYCLIIQNTDTHAMLLASLHVHVHVCGVFTCACVIACVFTPWSKYIDPSVNLSLSSLSLSPSLSLSLSLSLSFLHRLSISSTMIQTPPKSPLQIAGCRILLTPHRPGTCHGYSCSIKLDNDIYIYMYMNHTV